ncbi:MAG: hypothetical protein ACOX6T_03345 [Myxococcales bacterium]
MNTNSPDQLAAEVFAPPPDLAATVAMGWSLESSRDARSGFYEFLPDSSANLILRLSPTSCRMVLWAR